MTKELTVLLDKLGTINYKYSLLKEKDRFNVFEILRKSHDEVHLHSRFIAELLNPKGTHGQSKVFLELFVEMLQNNIKNDEDFKQDYDFKDLEQASVIVEHYTDKINKDKTKGGNIDIYIKDIGRSPIIIENKIYAEDQQNQLLRYHNYNKEALIIYLTLYGSKPSDDSKGGLQDSEILLLSYKEDIESWLEKCIEKSAKKPELREVIVQYQKLINKLTGNTTSMGEFKEIYKLLSENDNMKNARLISKNWNKIRIQTELDFWNALKNIIDISGKNKIDEQHRAMYSEDRIKDTINGKRGNKPYYGIVFKIGEYKSTDILFKIERGTHKIRYGFWADNYRKELNFYISDFDEQDNHASIGIKYLNPELNFSNFSNENTLKMCNKGYREMQVDKYWTEMQEFITKCEKAFGNEHYIPIH